MAKMPHQTHASLSHTGLLLHLGGWKIFPPSFGELPPPRWIYILNKIISISTSLLWQKGEKVMNSANITVKLSLQFLLWAPCELGIFLFIFQKIYLVGHMHSQSFDANLQCIEECFVTIPTKPCKKTQRYSTPFHTYTDPRLWSPDL